MFERAERPIVTATQAVANVVTAVLEEPCELEVHAVQVEP
jgi:hypothetical protein